MDAETARLRRHLESCPRDGAVAAVDEAAFAQSILQLDQSRQRSQVLLRETRDSVADRLQRWRLFEDAANRALGLIKRLSYARNMASIKGPADLQRLLSAKQAAEVSAFSCSLFCLLICMTSPSTATERKKRVTLPMPVGLLPVCSFVYQKTGCQGDLPHRCLVSRFFPFLQQCRLLSVPLLSLD